MKINGWIILGLIITLMTGARGLAESSKAGKDERLDKIESGLRNLQVKNLVGSSVPVILEDFQNHLWRAMALDPAISALVPPHLVPKNLFSDELTSELVRKLEDLKISPLAGNSKFKSEFNTYVQLAEKIIALRKNRKFPESRSIAKRGILEKNYFALVKKVMPVSTEKSSDANDIPELLNLVQSLRMPEANPAKNPKREVFTSGNQFVWSAFMAMLGFFLGIGLIRSGKLSQFFTPNPAATTQPQHVQHPTADRLDYTRWLREFEEILIRLKSSQLSHERRIEEVVQNSEKINQQVQSLYSDARIKNEANLEFRMAALVRDIQNQAQQGHKLQTGDRAKFGLVMEHCLRLCDAVENDALMIDRNAHPATPQSAAGDSSRTA